MIKSLAQFESVVQGKIGRFLLDIDTTVPVAKEMCLDFLKYLGQIEDAAKAQAAAASSEEQKSAEAAAEPEAKTE